ncbi:hypothetical protein [Polaribacter sp. R77954]|uniref:hypothetical protein n=1 Tax=Polaribacter sp. R77954 TaxID=3093870 RepID=UPI0037C58742
MILKKRAEDFHELYDAKIPTTTQRITLFTYLDVEDSNLEFTSLNVQYSTKITSDFSSLFWRNNNFISLPNM